MDNNSKNNISNNIMSKNKLQPFKVSSCSFLERHNIQKVKWILSLDYSERCELFYNRQSIKRINELFDNNGKKYTMKSHDNENIKYLHKIIKSKKELLVNYKPSKKQFNGRLYSTDHSIQRLGETMRNFLIVDLYEDYDMKNCFPTLLVYLFNKHGIACNFLNQYVKDREATLKITGLDKHDILTVLNQDVLTHKKKNNVLINFHRDVMVCKTKLGLNYPHLQTTNTNNPISSMISNLLCVTENEVLQKAINYLDKKNIGCLMFDGLLKYKDEVVNNQTSLNGLNEVTKKYDITWCIKPINNDIMLPSNIDEIIRKYEIGSYELIKKELETNCFLTLSPSTVHLFNNSKNEYVQYNYTNARHILANKCYMKNGKKTSIFDEWIRDETRRQYDMTNFLPYTLLDDVSNDKNIFNTFVPFDRNILDNTVKELEETNFIKNYLFPLINDLNGYDKNSISYFLKLWAFFFQKPKQISEVCWVCQSREGCGKDTYIRILSSIMNGEKYIAQTSNLDDVFGDFNKIASQKLLVQLNEVDTKQALAQHNRIKGVITSNTINVKLKGIDVFQENHYSQYVMFTNNSNNITVSDSARRWFITLAVGLLKNKFEFWKKLHDLLKDKLVLDQLYTYFMKLDISDFIPGVVPKTKIFDQQQLSQLHPVLKYLWSNCKRQWQDSGFDILTKKDIKYFIIKPQDFNVSFNMFCNENNIKACSSVKYNTLLDNLDCCKRIDIRMNVGVRKHIRIECSKIEKELDTNYFKTSERSFNPDECFGCEGDITSIPGNTIISSNEDEPLDL